MLRQVHWVHMSVLSGSRDAGAVCSGGSGGGGVWGGCREGGRQRGAGAAKAILCISSRVPLSLLWGRSLLPQGPWRLVLR